MPDQEKVSGSDLGRRAEAAYKAMNVSFVIGIVLAVVSTLFLFVRQ